MVTINKADDDEYDNDDEYDDDDDDDDDDDGHDYDHYDFFRVYECLWKEPVMPEQRNMPVRIYREGISLFVLSRIHSRTLRRGYS